MMLIATKIALVILAGIYAMRSAGVIFHPGPFTPMALVAMFAFVMSVIYFYRPPTVPGPWLYTAVPLFLFGVLANSILFFAPDKAHSDPVNMTFSAVSIAGWGLLAIVYGLRIFNRAV
jgi:hypothetical protein